MKNKISDYLENYFHQIKHLIEVTVIINKDNSERVLPTLLDSFIIQRENRKPIGLLTSYDYILLDLFINEGPVETINLAMTKLKDKVFQSDLYTIEDVDRVCEICKINLSREYIINYIIRRIAFKIKHQWAPQITTEFDESTFNTYCIFDYDFNYLKAWLFYEYSIEEIKNAVRLEFESKGSE